MASPPNLRIICLSQGASDAICALGLDSCFVGRSHDCSGPPSVLALPCVSSNSMRRQSFPTHASDDKTLRRSLARFGVNWELLQELEPDLMFIQGQTGDDAPSSQRAPRESYWGTTKKCRIVSLESHTIEDVFRALETIAECCGARKDGIELVNGLRSRWKLIKQKTPQWADGMPWVSVACLSSVNPLTGAGYWIPEIISCAGGSSLCGRAGYVGNSLTLGDLLQKDPDVIVFLCHGFSIESIARELSWLKNDKTWRQLRAIKANRFFVADADRFFIDSGPNVVLSAEMMVEILHGFGYGHDGKGFLRWQSYPSAVGVDVQKHPSNDESSSEMPGSLSVDAFGSKGLNLKQSSQDNDEVLKESLVVQSSTHDHPKYVTDVYESKKNHSAERNRQDQYSCKSKLDSCNGAVFGEVEQKDLMEDRYSQESGVVEVENQRSLNANNSRHMTPLVSEPMSPALEVMVWDEPGEKWQKPMKEIFLHKRAGSSLAKSRSLVSQNSRIKESTPVQVQKPHEGELANTHMFLKQSSLEGKVKSTLITDKRLVQGSLEQELISKVWASTQSAAKARSGITSVTKDRMLNKSRSVAVCSGVLPGKNSGVSSTNGSEVIHKWKSLPRQVVTPVVSSHDCELPRKDLSSAASTRNISRNLTGVVGDEACGLKRQQLSTMVDRSLGQSSADESLKKKSFHRLNPVNSTKKGMSRNPKILRDLVLDSLAEIQSPDCLLLSGGLASSILAEAAPLVRSGGFKLGFTVIAGPTATDRAFAEDVVKRCAMEHVVIGDRGKGSAVALLASELTFVVQTLRTFDPVQIRNFVPIAAALKAAKCRGFNYVVTGDGMDELFSGDLPASTSVHGGHTPLWDITKAVGCSAVLLGEALGLKVLQPFLHPKIVEHFKTLHRADMKVLDDVDIVAIGSGTPMSNRSFLRRAFPEVAAACREKDSIEVGSGLSTVSEYFCTTISVSAVQSKAKHIKQKDEVCIRDAEHLVYYRAFKRVFKGKVPPGMIKGGTDPCVGCGYQLSSGMSSYCLVCGHNVHSIGDQIREDKVKYSHEVTGAKSSPSRSSNDIPKYRSCSSKVNFEIDKPVARRDSFSDCKASKELAHALPESGEAANERIKLEKRDSIRNKRNYVKGGAQSTSESCKTVHKPSTGSDGLLDPNREWQKATRPKYLLALGVGSAALLLLIQLSKH